MDTVSKEQRSRNMSRIRSTDTKPEMIVRQYLYKNGFRYRVNVKTLPGSPDIVLKKYHTAIFIHGCFWHRHECQNGRFPQTNIEFWQQKFTRNVERDALVREQLRMLGWKTMIVWECQLKKKIRQQTLQEITYLLNKANLDVLHKKYQLSSDNSIVTIAAEDSIKYGN
ncbi:MAG: very short patch repair endonuclease [Bacteroidales bacterium]|nr:very short patch repair endonuclease [Bacteroidales bacterium]